MSAFTRACRFSSRLWCSSSRRAQDKHASASATSGTCMSCRALEECNSKVQVTATTMQHVFGHPHYGPRKSGRSLIDATFRSVRFKRVYGRHIGCRLYIGYQELRFSPFFSGWFLHHIWCLSKKEGDPFNCNAPSSCSAPSSCNVSFPQFCYVVQPVQKDISSSKLHWRSVEV